MLAGLAAVAAGALGSEAATTANAFLELKTWRLHNSHENQLNRVTQFLEQGLAPGLSRAGSKLAGAFSLYIGPDAPSLVTLTQFASLAAMQDTTAKLAIDHEYLSEVEKLGTGSGLPFVRIESNILRAFDSIPAVVSEKSAEGRGTRVFEMRMYEAPTLAGLTRKVGMFNGGEMALFERLKMRPVFGGETIAGARQPNLIYMLSFDDLAQREELWGKFGSDPEWKHLSAPPELSNAETVGIISNSLWKPLSFSSIR